MSSDSFSCFQGGAGKATEIQLLAQAVQRRWLFSSRCVLVPLEVRLGLSAVPGPLNDFLLMHLQCSLP